MFTVFLLLLLLLLLLAALVIKKLFGFSRILQSAESTKFEHMSSSGVLMFIGGALPLAFSWIFQNYGVRQNGKLVLLISKIIDKVTVYSFIFRILFPALLFSVLVLCLVHIIADYMKGKKYCPLLLSAPGIYDLLFLFSVLYAVFSITICFSAFDAFSFSNKDNEGYFFGTVPNGLAIPEISPLLLVIYSVLGVCILIAAALLFNVSFETLLVPCQQKKRKRFRMALTVVSLILLLLAFIIPFSSSWVIQTFGTISAEQLLFQLRVPMKGTNTDFYVSFFWKSIVPALFLFFVALFCIHPFLKNDKCYKLSAKPMRKQFMIKIPNWATTTLIMFISTAMIITRTSDFSQTIGFGSYFKNIVSATSFIDENYVDPHTVQITFPEKRRNLIYIFMESMENSYMSADVGGAQPRNLIPELTQIAQENVSFSHTDQLGGIMQLNASSWTIAGMVGQHMGLPLQLPIQANSYDQFETFMPGAYGLGDILRDQGYTQTLLVGSDAEFGGRKSFYTQHGDFKVLDLYTSWTDGIVSNGRKVWWGFEDIHLYDYAKEELAMLAAQEKPFNLTMLTVDTHSEGGYYCSLCKNENQDQYWNVISCASRQLDQFLSWLQKQSFYEDTTVIIAGDHLSMDVIVTRQSPSGYLRTAYNAFINSAVSAKNTKNRMFASIDMFPTILASMGVEIKGNRLALGTNLFSDQETLLEQYGYEKVNSSMSGYSKKYNSLLMNDK